MGWYETGQELSKIKVQDPTEVTQFVEQDPKFKSSDPPPAGTKNSSFSIMSFLDNTF